MHVCGEFHVFRGGDGANKDIVEANGQLDKAEIKRKTRSQRQNQIHDRGKVVSQSLSSDETLAQHKKKRKLKHACDSSHNKSPSSAGKRVGKISRQSTSQKHIRLSLKPTKKFLSEIPSIPHLRIADSHPNFFKRHLCWGVELFDILSYFDTLSPVFMVERHVRGIQGKTKVTQL